MVLIGKNQERDIIGTIDRDLDKNLRIESWAKIQAYLLGFVPSSTWGE